MAFCNACGARLNDNARFCIKCGNKVPTGDEDMAIKEVLPETEYVSAPEDGEIAVKEVLPVDEDTAVKEPFPEESIPENGKVGIDIGDGDTAAQALEFSRETAAALDSPLPLEATRPRKKSKALAVVGILLVFLLLLGAGGWYVIKVSSPDKLVENFANSLGTSKYDTAYKYLEMDDMNAKVKNLESEKDFVNWQQTLDIKEGPIKDVKVNHIVIYEWGWGKKEGSGRAALEIERDNSKEEINLPLKSKPNKKLGLIPDWQLIYPSTIIDFGEPGLFEGTEVFLNGAKILTTGNLTGDKLKVETYSGDHLVTFSTALSQPVELYPVQDMEGIIRSDFVIKPEEEEAIKQAVMNLAKVEGKFWNSKGQNLQSLMDVSANGSTYPNFVKGQVDEFMSQFDEYQICNSISKTINVNSIYDIEIIAADTVRCSMDAYYDMQVAYSIKDYDWYMDDYTYTDQTYKENGTYFNTYEIKKEGGEWKISERF